MCIYTRVFNCCYYYSIKRRDDTGAHDEKKSVQRTRALCVYKAKAIDS
jgi:hypothetical protein